MRQGIVKASGKAAASHRTEWLWGGLGVGTAGLSACFAAYMLAFGPGSGVPSASDFGLFARMRPNPRVAEARVPPVLQGSAQLKRAQGETAGAAPAPTVDFTPTGSVADKPGDVKAAAIDRAAETTLPSFILRDVFDGRALVESPSALTLVSKGSVIVGAGRVLSIERRGGQWAVITSGGIIGGLR